MLFKISVHRKTPVLAALFDKIAGIQVCKFIKKRLQRRCFPVKFAKFFRTPFFYRTPPVAASVNLLESPSLPTPAQLLVHLFYDFFPFPLSDPLRKKCPYSDFLWPVFFRIRSEYGETLCISPYSIQMRENTDQKNFEYGHYMTTISLFPLPSTQLQEKPNRSENIN